MRKLLDKGSKQENIWGINIYPDKDIRNMIEFDSIINVRPSLGITQEGLEDKDIQKKITDIVISKISFE